MTAIFLLVIFLIVVCRCLTNTPPVILEEVQKYPDLCTEKCFIVFGHTSEGKGIIHEVFADDSAEALNRVQAAYPDQRFNHCNLR